MNKEIETDILKTALSQFSQLTGGKVKVLATERRKIDAEIEMRLGKEKHGFLVEVKHELRQAAIPAILAMMGKQKDSWLLISKYIPQPIKTQLKEQGYNYLETSGNCYINTAGLFVYINNRPVSPYRTTPAGKLWKPSGLKFLFAILSDPALLDAPYRTIAEAAGIALGNIGPLLAELQTQYFKKTDGKELLLNRDALIQKWTEMYPVILKPGLQQGRFRFLTPSLRQKWKAIYSDKFVWGGEPAGDLYTNFLEPERYTIYSDREETAVMKELQLVPDKGGEVSLLKRFWSNIVFKNANAVPHAVPPLLAYADLMDTDNSRNWEVAERIKNKYLND